MSKVEEVLAKFKAKQRSALQTQADLRQEREERLAKAEGERERWMS